MFCSIAICVTFGNVVFNSVSTISKKAIELRVDVGNIMTTLIYVRQNFVVFC